MGDLSALRAFALEIEVQGALRARVVCRSLFPTASLRIASAFGTCAALCPAGTLRAGPARRSLLAAFGGSSVGLRVSRALGTCTACGRLPTAALARTSAGLYIAIVEVDLRGRTVTKTLKLYIRR